MAFNAMDVDSDFSEADDETDALVQDYLNDTRVESVQAKRKENELVYTKVQLERISLYKNAITINRETETGYKKLEDSLIRMLAQVRRKLKENEKALKTQTGSSSDGGFNYLRCGKPYFKDKHFFSPPDNEDTIMMKQSGMYDFSQVCSVHGWTVNDKTELVNALLEMSKDLRRAELMSKLTKLRRNPENIMEVTKLEREINQLNKKTLNELALPLDQEYDWERLANSMNRRHTAKEYRALWKLFFHPSINKRCWTKIEHYELKRIASNHNMQDWDTIAKELNTGRTGYQCFVYYRTNMIDNILNRKWTSEEMEYLQRVADYFREGTYIPWGKVAAAMDGRTKIQVYNKFKRMMERRKGRFLEEEDIVLLNCADKFGNDFKKISEFLPGRSAVQLRNRYQILTKFRLSTTWSVEDDKKLIQIMATQDSSASSFSNATKHFPGKDRVNIRSRYLTLSKWMRAHPASDISMAPRRGARRLLHGNAAISLRDAIANLHKRIEMEVNSKKKKKVTMYSCEEDIDDAIMASLMNEIIKEEVAKKPDQPDSEENPCPEDVSDKNMTNLQYLLILLKASLEKEKFDNSKYAAEYPELSVVSHTKDPHQKVKSYSKTKKVCLVDTGNLPDIWGEKPPLQRTFTAIPPNYATITGCRVLMKHFGIKVCEPGDDINLSLMQRRNIFLKESIDKLKERFTTLFMWPILLSNDLPNIPDSQDYVSQPCAERKLLPHPTGLTIPVVTRRCSCSSKPKRGQDSDESDDEQIVIDVPKRRKEDIDEIQCSTSGNPSHFSEKLFSGDDDDDGDSHDSGS